MAAATRWCCCNRRTTPIRRPSKPNICYHDNEALARYLVKDFVSFFGAYRGLASLTNLTYRKLDSVAAIGRSGFDL